MPRTGRGGKRVGKPGTAYPNRTDLNRPNVGQAYGVAKQQADALKAVPLSPPAAPVSPPTGAAAGGGFTPPGSFGAFDRPTEFPDEPVTAGIDLGPGPGAPSVPVSPAAKVMTYLASLPTATPIVRQLAYEVGKKELDPYV